MITRGGLYLLQNPHGAGGWGLAAASIPGPASNMVQSCQSSPVKSGQRNGVLGVGARRSQWGDCPGTREGCHMEQGSVRLASQCSMSSLCNFFWWLQNGRGASSSVINGEERLLERPAAAVSTGHDLGDPWGAF